MDNQDNQNDDGPPEQDRDENPLSLNPIENNNEQEEEEEDFPDYANEQNKQLNQIVKNYSFLFSDYFPKDQRKTKIKQRNKK